MNAHRTMYTGSLLEWIDLCAPHWDALALCKMRSRRIRIRPVLMCCLIDLDRFDASGKKSDNMEFYVVIVVVIVLLHPPPCLKYTGYITR